MFAKLVSERGVLEGLEKPLSPDDVCVIGRSKTAGLAVDDDRVSREHCRIWVDGGFYKVQDLNSSNGTWVNGKRVSQAILFHGDRLNIGGEELRFELEADLKTGTEGIGSEEDVGADQFATNIAEQMQTVSASSLAELSGLDDSDGLPADVERELAAICHVIDMVHSEERLDRLFEAIMDYTMDVTSADRGYLFGGLRPGGLIAPHVARYSDGTPAASRKCFSRTVVSECYETGFSILRADPMSRIADLSASTIRQRIQSVMCVPMNCEEGTVGVIYVDKLRGDKKFTKRDLRILSALGNEAGIAVRRAQLTHQVETLFGDTIRTLVKIIEIKDGYTHSHSERVMEVSLLLGKLADLGAEEMRDLQLAALLHDVGKIGVRSEVLKKPSKLTHSEYEDMSRHAVYSAEIVGSVKNAESIATAIRHHHERWDGTGYPDGLAGEDIPPVACIIAIADAYDAMAAGRPYKDRLSPEELIEELERCCGTQFEPNLAGKLAQTLRADTDFQARIRKVYRKAQTADETNAVRS